MTFTPSPHTDEVLLERDEHVCRIKLNRPQAINALNVDMCRAIFDAVADFDADGTVHTIELSGEGRGLCAGGDVRAVRQAILNGDVERAYSFFEVEYATDQRIAHSNTPVTAHQQGVVMGGGLGISAHAAHRLAYANAHIAMPETIIGFHPDVGMMWPLAKAPGELGVHLALTGQTINATDAVLVGFADLMAPGETAPAPTIEDAEWIRECYAGDDASAIIARLENSAAPAAREAAAQIRLRSPLSVWVALQGIRRAAHMETLADVFALDATLAWRAMFNPDFVEGVRAQLVDKDKNPRWQHARIEDVPAADVEAMFVPR